MNERTLKTTLKDRYAELLHRANGCSLFGIPLAEMGSDDLRVAFQLNEDLHRERHKSERMTDKFFAALDAAKGEAT